VGERALEDQDCGRLGKGRTFAKDLQISHPTNASTRTCMKSSPIEPTTNVRII
jgi:hypothetical protein